MEKLVFGFIKANASMATKLIVCEETKQFEYGQCCVNSSLGHIDVWVKQKDLKVLMEHYKSIGYQEVEEKFYKGYENK